MKYWFSILFFITSSIPIFAQINIIQNGNFQTQNFAWSSSGNFFYGNPNLANCFSCPGYAYTAVNFAGAGGNNYFGDLIQQVTVPAITIHISFAEANSQNLSHQIWGEILWQDVLHQSHLF